MVARKALPRKPSEGELLIAALSEDGDPYSLEFLIKLAGHHADYLERLGELLRGDRDAWVQVKIGAKTVEVIVTDVLRQHRQTAEQLRKLLTSIKAQRVSMPSAPDDSDDPTAV